MTRRELFGMAGVGVVAVAGGGAYVWSGRTGDGSPTGDEHFTVRRSDGAWRAHLSPAAYRILRHGATEAPFSSPLLNEHRTGRFACAGCATVLFDARTKYDSHTGWPSFWQALPAALTNREDRTLGFTRTELRCATCGGHLGHRFDDGPAPTGLRYCMNGFAMGFIPARA